MTGVTDPQQQLSFRSTPRMREETKSPDEDKPVGVNVSIVGRAVRREAVALHALKTGLLDVDLHRLTSRRSRRSYLRAVVL